MYAQFLKAFLIPTNLGYDLLFTSMFQQDNVRISLMMILVALYMYSIIYKA